MLVRIAITATTLLLALTGCSNSPTSNDAAKDDEDHLSPCSLVSRTTLDEIREAADVPSGASAPDPGVGLKDGDEQFVACGLVGSHLTVGVQGVDTGRSLEEIIGTDGDGSPEPLDGVGDEALIGMNSWDGYRIVAREGQDVVMVDSRFNADHSDVSRDQLIDLAEEAVAGLDGTKLEPIDLPSACPAVDHERVTNEMGPVMIARGVDKQDWVSCQYAGEASFMNLSVVKVDPATVTMMQADSQEDPVDVDGDPAYFDHSDTVTIVASETCLITASTYDEDKPRSDEELRATVLELAEFTRDEIDCPD